MLLCDVCLSRTSGLSREHRGLGRPKFGLEVAHVTRDSDTTFKVKRSKVKVTRPLCSPPCWRVRRLQRWVWERVGRGKLLLYVAVWSAAQSASAPTGVGGGTGAYRGGRPPTACYNWITITDVTGHLPDPEMNPGCS